MQMCVLNICLCVCVEGGFQSPDIMYSETSHNRPALVPKIMAVLEGWPVL
jgi:hypothetical protein